MELGRLYSHLLSSARSKEIVDNAARSFAAGFRDYLERSQPIEDLQPIGQLIRGESS
jgi:hypothetical protein